MTNEISKSWFAGVLPEHWDNLDSVQSQVCDPMLQKLFRIFLMLSERSVKKQGTTSRKSALWIHVEEIQLFASILSHHLPAVRSQKANEACQHGFYHYCGLNGGLASLESSAKEYTFKEFSLVLAHLFPYDREEFSIALVIAYDSLINQVLKKGFLLWSSQKPGSYFHTWQRRWAVVKPGRMTFYKSPTEQEKIKDLFLSADCTAEVTNIKSAVTAMSSPLYEFKLIMPSGKRRYIATFDILERRQWITALQFASRNAATDESPNSSGNVHRRAFLRRRQIRIEKSSTSPSQSPQVSSNIPSQGSAISCPAVASVCTTTIENAPTSKSENDRTLEDEAFWRNLTVEALCKELEKERLRANRLAVEKKRVQDQLDKECLAIKDEEIVRSLATRLLEEERVQRNALEAKLGQFMEQLQEERGLREKLESREQCHRDEIERLKEKLENSQMTHLSKKLLVVEHMELIIKLKQDQEALLKDQMEIRCELLQQQLSCNQRFEEAKHILNKLIENSGRVCS